MRAMHDMQCTTHAMGGTRVTGLFAGDIPGVIPIKVATEEEWRRRQSLMISLRESSDIFPTLTKTGPCQGAAGRFFLSDAGVFPHQYNVLRLGMRTDQ